MLPCFRDTDAVATAVRAVDGVAGVREEFTGTHCKVHIRRGDGSGATATIRDARTHCLVTSDWDSSARQPRWWVPVDTVEGLVQVLGAWAAPGLSTRDRMILVAQRCTRWSSQKTPPGLTGAQSAFSLVGKVPRRFPQCADGRYMFAGCIEPYPGAWPRHAVRSAFTGDLTALWPYLSAPPDTSG